MKLPTLSRLNIGDTAGWKTCATFLSLKTPLAMKLVVVLILDSLGLTAAPWLNLAPLNVARHSHTATLLLDGKVLLAGGGVTSVLTNSAELYDPATGKCQPTGFMTEPRRNATATTHGQSPFRGGH
jgi:hypothetical protein